MSHSQKTYYLINIYMKTFKEPVISNYTKWYMVYFAQTNLKYSEQGAIDLDNPEHCRTLVSLVLFSGRESLAEMGHCFWKDTLLLIS